MTGTLILLFAASLAASDQPLNRPAPPNASAPPRLKSAEATGAEDLHARRKTVGRLIAAGRSATPRALELLGSSDAENRAAAIYVLAAIGASDTAPKIIDAAMSDRDDRVRLQAAEALGSMGAPESIRCLIRAAGTDSNRDVRVRAIVSLGRIDSPAVIAPIRQHLESPRSDAEYEAAATAAGLRRIVAVEPDLIAACADSSRTDHARSAAAVALGLMHSANAHPTLVRLTHDGSAVVRFNAIQAIEELQDTQAVGDLRRILADEREEQYVRIRAASALARIGTSESFDALRTVAAGPDEFMAMHAIVAVRQTDAGQARALAASLRSRAKDPFVVGVADRVARNLPLPWGQR
jgi:HEAT repeat protein